MKRLPVFLLIITITSALKGFGNEKQKWSLVNIRENAHIFYWLYYTTAEVENVTEKPLIIWLQGGPGGSSTGYGNFAEIGPLDTDLNPRNTTWIKDANILFVDNPVGTGFSFVEKTIALTKNNREIAEDFLLFLKKFYEENPEFKSTPLYIFSESYGGKMTVEIALVLNQAILDDELKSNFRGIGLGDPWMSPIDSVMTWAPYLLHLGAIDQNGYNQIEIMANKTKNALDNGDFINATKYWGETERTIIEVTSGIDFYNVLTEITHFLKNQDLRGVIFKPESKLRSIEDEKIQMIMNNNVSKALNISNEWGAQSGEVFLFLFQDFMKPATSIVEELLNKTDIKIAIFNGQLDLIVDTPGTVKWVDNLKWKGSDNWKTAERDSFSVNGVYEGYVKKEGNLALYWINRAGHMVPVDNPAAMNYILKDITNDFNSDILLK